MECLLFTNTLSSLTLLLIACAPLTQDQLTARYDVDQDGIEWDEDCDDDDASVGRAQWYFVDGDGDEYGLPTSAVQSCTQPVGFVLTEGDCDDLNDQVHPAAPERCNGIDDNCDGEVDETQSDYTVRWYHDDDRDGFGGAFAAEVCDGQSGWVSDGSDCDDADASVNPGALERCGDGLDNDCDGLIDDDSAADADSWFWDGDGDGFGDPTQHQRSCVQAAGFVAVSGDCADADPAIHPLAPERCDGVDNDCNTAVDDADPWLVDPPNWYEDADGDGFGSGVARDVGCELPPGFSDNNLDCADTNSRVHPDASEICDGIDNDCDERVDADDFDLDMSTTALWFPDADHDGFGGWGPVVRSCEQPLFHVSGASDCDDNRAEVWPGAPELCDELDNDCDEIIDEDLPTVWFPDDDGDGFGTLAGIPIAQCAPIDGYSAVLADCDDTQADVHPGAVERCDGLDNDCNELVDDDETADGLTWYRDSDGDGAGWHLITTVSCEQPEGYAPSPDDCDDTRPSVYTGAQELCDDLDNDCDGVFDDEDADLIGGAVAYADADLDGYGDAELSLPLCRLRAGYRWNAEDCDDQDGLVHPDGSEECNGKDDDCNGLTDDEDPGVDPWDFVAIYADLDGDGYGDLAQPPACSPAEGSSDRGGDCQDDDVAIYPGAQELCDGLDNDCNGLVDDGTPPTWYRDADGDGHGVASNTVVDCVAPGGYVAVADDCDDTDSNVHPGHLELCNGVDDDCDSLVDGDDADLTGTSWFLDNDADGYGSEGVSVYSCEQPADHVSTGGDCDDTDTLVHPGAEEVCGGRDEDCDGLIDEQDPDLISPTTWHPDADRDGFGDPGGGLQACTRPLGYVADGSDCDDGASKIHPGAPEICGGADDDCDGLVDDADPSLTGAPLWYHDDDGDGFGTLQDWVKACEAPAGTVADSADCNDSLQEVNPGASEIPGNGVDEDCDNEWRCYLDSDGDGFGSVQTVVDGGDQLCTAAGEATAADDCDDEDPDTHPGAPEACGAVDHDCDGEAGNGAVDALTWFVDADGDGYGDSQLTQASCEAPEGFVAVEGDCDDDARHVHPDAPEICDPWQQDEDCDGLINQADPDMETALWYFDGDGDGYGSGKGLSTCDPPAEHVTLTGDCADASAEVNPGAAELPGNEVDENCDGQLLCTLDADQDGFGDAQGGTVLSNDLSCQQSGESLTADDCDDGASEVNPEAQELCDPGDVDEDCDGQVDDADPDTVRPGWYLDGDSDTHGAGDPVFACDAPAQHVAQNADCNDGNSAIHPDASETAGNEVDENCDGQLLCTLDADLDGFGDAQGATVLSNDLSCQQPGESLTADDCDDGASEVNPEAQELCDPGDVDEDCDGQVDDADPDTVRPGWYLDGDSDTHGAGDPVFACDAPAQHVAQNADCNDGNSAIHPDASETAGNEVDENCDGQLLCTLDADLDGFGDAQGATVLSNDQSCQQPGESLTADDCDDEVAEIHPEASEFPGNQVDEDCDGTLLCYLDADRDGHGSDTGETVWSPDALCEAAESESTVADDCDDLDAAVNPGLGTCINTHPIAELALDAVTLEAGALLEADASLSTDAESASAVLQVRFDWDNDGTFETAFSTDKVTTHSYTLPGVYEVTVEVRDPAGLSDFETVAVSVAEAGSILVVDTSAADGDDEVFGGPYTGGLSLIEAITLANDTPGNQTITFSGPMVVDVSSLPSLVDADGVQIVGVPGVHVQGAPIDFASGGNTLMGVELSQAAAGVRFQSGSGNVVRDCVLHDNGEAIDINSAGNVVGPGNDLYGNGSSGTSQLYVEHSTEVVGNRIHDGPGGGIYVAGDSTVIQGNWVYANGIYGIGNGADGVIITDNTIYGNGDEGYQSFGGTGLVFLNNVVAANTDDGMEAASSAFAPGSPDHNLWFANAGGNCDGCTPGPGAVFDDPLLTPPALYPLQGSPVIDAGSTSSTYDKNGATPGLYDGAAPDIGATETRY